MWVQNIEYQPYESTCSIEDRSEKNMYEWLGMVAMPVWHLLVLLVVVLFVCFSIIQGCFNTPLEHTPKPLPTGYKGIPFIVG